MTDHAEVEAFLRRHLDAVFADNVEEYHATTSDDLTLYEWFVTPHRIDGLPFHDFQMSEAARRGGVYNDAGGESIRYRYDLANLRIQRYGDAAIATFTLLVSKGDAAGVKVESHNESRVMVKLPDGWRVVHVHKSPSWNAPYQPPK
ncbi:MAG: nuclear transport factor 2 family protein [Chloroflexi bacterium]|nr:nuclear transport factor 2 family protein [Chloroflexota bacterium]